MKADEAFASLGYIKVFKDSYDKEIRYIKKIPTMNKKFYVISMIIDKEKKEIFRISKTIKSKKVPITFQEFEVMNEKIKEVYSDKRWIKIERGSDMNKIVWNFTKYDKFSNIAIWKTTISKRDIVTYNWDFFIACLKSLYGTVIDGWEIINIEEVDNISYSIDDPSISIEMAIKKIDKNDNSDGHNWTGYKAIALKGCNFLDIK